jgi:hypothetical protein
MNDNEEMVLQAARAWMEAAARCDIEAIANGMAENCLRYGEPSWMTINKADYIDVYRQYLISFSDYRLTILNTVVSGRSVVFEMIESATFSKPYPLPGGSGLVQPSGQSYTDHACTWLEIDEAGKVAEIRAYIPSTRGQMMAEAMAATET